MKKRFSRFLSGFLACILTLLSLPSGSFAEKEKPIRWVECTVPAQALREAAEMDIASQETECPLSMPVLLACLAAQNGGDFSNYKKAKLDALADRLRAGETPSAIVRNEKALSYYLRAYHAIFDGFLGRHRHAVVTESGETTYTEEYGIEVYSPIAKGFSYSHYDDFGASRSFGYKRHHLGHDLMGAVGTPIIAVESGIVEACGWNRFGGWRIGIRSFDGLRYYYYAHLRKDHPFTQIQTGDIVYAGEVIGYMGMTGYSSRENVNNIDVPHLHFGLQLIFSPEQKEGNNQIWLDLMALTEFLSVYRAPTKKNDAGERVSLDYCIPDHVWDS